mgnify:CR=1 FL=1
MVRPFRLLAFAPWPPEGTDDELLEPVPWLRVPLPAPGTAGMEAAFGARPTVTYYDNHVVVDNEAGAVRVEGKD